MSISTRESAAMLGAAAPDEVFVMTSKRPCSPGPLL